MRRALHLAARYNLDVRIVSYGTPSRALVQLAEEFDQIEISGYPE
jgi:hypothetical protein